MLPPLISRNSCVIVKVCVCTERIANASCNLFNIVECCEGAEGRRLLELANGPMVLAATSFKAIEMAEGAFDACASAFLNVDKDAEMTVRNHSFVLTN